MEQNTLRLILLMLGIAILLGIYFSGRSKKPEELLDDELLPEDLIQRRVAPVISEEVSVEQTVADSEPEKEPLNEAAPIGPLEDIPEVEVTAIQSRQEVEVDPLLDSMPPNETEPTKEAVEVSLIQLAVLAQSGEVFEGDALLKSFTELKLEFGEMGIFHFCQRENGQESQLFHLANMLEPGVFPEGSMAGFETKGLMLFMQAADVKEPVAAFEEMLMVAHRLSESFNARLMDDKMQALTLHRMSEIKAELAASTGL